MKVSGPAPALLGSNIQMSFETNLAKGNECTVSVAMARWRSNFCLRL